MNSNPRLDSTPEVAQSLAQGKAIVALESTIISHGMPWPQNFETALAVEAEVRASGAVPATIAIMGGKLKAGLSRAELELLAKAGHEVTKASRRDIPRLLASGGIGATTVAGTMLVAAMAGIKIFATGGLGGVHRGAERSWDVSADLEELARSSVAVICAGAKAILDLPMTLEYLETRGVPVIGYGTDELPAFYTRTSGLPLVERADSPEEVAARLAAKWDCGLAGGVVIANPIPAQWSMEPCAIASAIERALASAEADHIQGKNVTPYLLAKVAALTGGDSLASNIALVKNNARLAARIAVAFSAGRTL